MVIDTVVVLGSQDNMPTALGLSNVASVRASEGDKASVIKCPIDQQKECLKSE